MHPRAEPGTEAAGLYTWRLEEFKRLGYSTSDAAEMALTPTIGTHELADLVKHGCDRDLARQICT